MRLDHPGIAADMAASSTTLTDLLLVGPLPDATYRGFTLLDVDVTYTPSAAIGEIVFKARTGMETSAMQASADLGVDNAEVTTLATVAGFPLEGFTQAQIDAGALDKCPFVLYRVNYNNLTSGRHAIKGGGTIGEQRTKFGQFTVVELRSLSQQLKQVIGEVDSLTCRAKFGSMPIGTGGGVVEERFPCGFDISGEWVDGVISAVGTETDREFTDETLTQDADYFAPGVVEMLTGDNAGQTREIDTFASGGVFGMQFAFVSAQQVGDTFRVRRECSKNKDGHNGCQTFWLTDWVLHFRGEPHIPVGDTAKLNSPGAAIAGSIGGTGEATV